jgi:site-specific recombinase XerD
LCDVLKIFAPAGPRGWQNLDHQMRGEGFARELEAKGRARATVTRRLCTIAGLYRYAVEEELLDHRPAALVRRPRVDYEPHAVALDRNELGALLVTAGLGPPTLAGLVPGGAGAAAPRAGAGINP